MDLGATLKGARERNGLSLEEVARRTKITVRVLRAIENNDFHAVPGGIFTRGYLRAYAREVGLDPTATVEHYLTCSHPGETPAAPPSRTHTDEEPFDDSPVAKGFGTYETPYDSGSEAGKAIAIALASLGVVAYLSLGGPPAPPDEPADDVASATGPTEVAPAMLLASDPAQPVATAGETLEVEIRPTGPCWVEATADGDRRVYRLMQAGDREVFQVHDTLVLRVGNPGAFAFAVNGRPAQLPGRPGQPITIRIGPGNFTEFLSAT